jgi:hypothetical protein
VEQESNSRGFRLYNRIQGFAMNFFHGIGHGSWDSVAEIT